MPAPTVLGSNACWSPSASARIGKILAMSINAFGIPSGGNQMLEMNVNGRITRFTTTGAASAFGMNRVIPIPSVVNAAVPSASVSSRPGIVEARTWTL